MKQTEERAIHSFRSGLNCAQAVLTAYSEDLSFNLNLAMSISCGFGGGIESPYFTHNLFSSELVRRAIHYGSGSIRGMEMPAYFRRQIAKL